MATFKVQQSVDAAPKDQPGSAYLNNRTGWWDASFLYGQTESDVAKGRDAAGGRLKMPGGALPIDDEGLCCLGDQHNSWVGVTCLQVRARCIGVVVFALATIVLIADFGRAGAGCVCTNLECQRFRLSKMRRTV